MAIEKKLYEGFAKFFGESTRAMVKANWARIVETLGPVN